MSVVDLANLSLKDLKQLQKDVGKAISTFEARQRAEALAAVEAKAKELGFSLTDLLGATSKKKPVTAPKYQHPENPSLTWTGRGRRPEWIKQADAAGTARDTFLIKS